MINQIRSEWIKLRSVRSSLGMLGAAVLLGVGVAAGAAVVAKGNLDVSGPLLGVQIAQLIFMVLGVQIIGQEYRFNTIRPTFSTTPNRRRVVVAKGVVLLTSVAAAAAVLIAAAIGIAKLILTMKGHSLDMSVDGTWRVIGGTLFASVAGAAFGYGIGTVVKQPIAGIMVALGWTLVGEVIIGALVSTTLRWLPFSSISNLLAIETDTVHMKPLVGAGYLIAICVAMVGLGTRLVRTADA